MRGTGTDVVCKDTSIPFSSHSPFLILMPRPRRLRDEKRAMRENASILSPRHTFSGSMSRRVTHGQGRSQT